MISDKIKAMKTTLSLASARHLSLNRGIILMLQRQLSDIHEQVLHLEQAQVPPEWRQPRPSPTDIASGKVALMATERPLS